MFRSIIRHTYVLLGALCLLTTTSRADVRTALASGNWSVAATWSSGHSPEDGDTLIIPAGITVSVTANLSYSGEAMRIRIYGTLFFNGSGSKLSLPCNSIVELMTTEATMAGNASGSSQTLKICNTAVWSVGANNNAHGPADYPTGATLPVELLYFTGDTREAMVQLRWSTGSEMNSDHFELRRSQDGAEGSVIASVAAAGSSQQVSTY
ncbi:MAG TPA: hypothetical protein VKG92_00145, partial [Flavobacteriales bacterium]|nr:hypothetical protein [Flavobacteriales bacterium]